MNDQPENGSGDRTNEQLGEPQPAKVWTDVGSESDFEEGSSSELVVEGNIVALFKVENVLYAMDGVCPHQGGPLGKGELNGCILTCPWHGWQFDVQDGQSQLSPGVRHPCFDVKVESGRVLIDLASGLGGGREN